MDEGGRRTRVDADGGGRAHLAAEHALAALERGASALVLRACFASRLRAARSERGDGRAGSGAGRRRRGERAALNAGATRGRAEGWGRATARTSADSFGVAGAAALCFADFFLRRSGLGPPAFARDAIAGAPESAPRGGLFVPFSC